ncbi:MAG: M24 family metallopeptidase, partial [Spirochaetota bacterium]
MRIEKIREILGKEGKLPFYTASLVSIQYITGFDGSYAQLVISERSAHLITDGRYAEYAENLLDGKCTLHIQQGSGHIPILNDIARAEHISRLCIEDNALYLSSYNNLRDNLSGVTLDSAGDIIDRIRMVKDDSEIAHIRAAAAVADECCSHLVQCISPRMTEWDISVEIEHFYRTHGCRKSSFDSIVASGAASSMPHYIPSMTKILEKGAPLMIDMGCTLDDYNSDLTRTFFIES